MPLTSRVQMVLKSKPLSWGGSYGMKYPAFGLGSIKSGRSEKKTHRGGKVRERWRDERELVEFDNQKTQTIYPHLHVIERTKTRPELLTLILKKFGADPLCCSLERKETKQRCYSLPDISLLQNYSVQKEQMRKEKKECQRNWAQTLRERFQEEDSKETVRRSSSIFQQRKALSCSIASSKIFLSWKSQPF